ncbi:peroxidase-like [Trichoplusia ni]|uniref:Peroxidase-like n=1 Tax=Trichoplusia ni TaxID=7111 RepID=A0A7E5WF21_TRINI|nr:peroxidase-like [Trichoplusia ni]
MNYLSPILIFLGLCYVGAQDLPLFGTLTLQDMLDPGVMPSTTENSPDAQLPMVGKAGEEEVPVIYDAYFGKPITSKRRNFLDDVANGTILCTVAVKPCNKNEGRRVDGTCTNPKYPSRGAEKTPLPRLLPAHYGPGNTLRPARDGSELPSARLLRTSLIGDGFFRDHHFSTLATHFQVTSAGDNVDLLYLFRYTLVSDCCLGNTPNRVNPICIPIPVPESDPYLQRENIRCLNLTRVITYQEVGCLPNSLPAERYSVATPLLDLGIVYGNTELRSRSIRANQGGLLAFRMEGDREVPNGNSPLCIRNSANETSCYNYGDDLQGNLLPGMFLTTMWFFREHNRIARRLFKINPCWDDEKLFQTARKINIAQWQYIFYYELMPEILGRKNALEKGIIYQTHGYVNDFDPHQEPGVIREYIVGTRWFHTYQPGPLDMYSKGEYQGSISAPLLNLRSGYLANNNSEAQLTEGCYVQPADNFPDYVLAPDLVERVIPLLLASDVTATDFMRGRDAGFPPYNDYRKFCGMKPAKKWEDLYDTIDKDKVEILSRIYDEVDDLELMVAIYVERFMPGAFLGPTLYCIMVHNLLLWRQSDKFFFEHGGFPAALTIPQLNEIRQTSIARVLCDSGDDVKYIQPAAFFRQGPWNPPIPCQEIKGINLNKWKDSSCSKKK